MKTLLRITLLVASLLFGALQTTMSAATKTWNGSTVGSWQIASNWIPAGVPANGDALVFPNSATKLLTTNGAGGPVNFTSLSLVGDGYELRSSGTLVITNGLTNSGPVLSENTIFAAVRPGVSSTWNIGTRTTLRLASTLTISSVTLTGNVGGSFIVDGNLNGNFTSGFEKNGAGTMQINSTATLNNLQVNNGTLTVNGSLSSALRVDTGATLNGNGTVPAFTCAGTVSPGTGAAGRLTVSGGAPTFEAGSTLAFALNGTAPGTGHDQLAVSAPFDLSNATLALTASFTPTGGTALIIITNTSGAPFTSAFAGLPEGSFVTVGASHLRITYTGGNGNDVALIAASVWDEGSGGDFWEQAANWLGDVVPAAGNDLVFPRGVVKKLVGNGLPVDTAFRSIRIDADYDLRGTGVRLSHGLETFGTNTVNETAFLRLPVTLTAPQAFRTREIQLNLSGLIQNGGHTLTVVADKQVVMQNAFAGTGGLIKTGTNDLILRGTNTFSGPFDVERGSVLVFHAFGFGSPVGATTVRAGASLELSEPLGSITEPLTISGSISAIGAHTNRWAGAVTLPDNNVRIFHFDGAGLEFSGAVSGLGGFTLNGGTLRLAGTASYSGPTTNNAGTLVVNGSLASSDVFGTGHIAGKGLVRGLRGPFTVSPGDGTNSTGILTASGALDLTGGAVELNILGTTPGVQHDQLDLGGTLAGSPNLILHSASLLPFGLTVNVVRFPGTVPTGTQVRFGGTLLAEGAEVLNNGNRFRLSYAGGDGNDLTLTTVPTATGVTRIWDGDGGIGNRNLNSAVNWSGDVVPSRGDDLVFPASVPSNLRILQNNIPATNSIYNRIWFGGGGTTWILQGNVMKLLGGVVATNEGQLGNASFGNSGVELIGSQTWSTTNANLALNAPVTLNGHTLTLASELGSQIFVQSLVVGPGSVIATSGDNLFFSEFGAANVAVTIQGGRFFAGFGLFTGPVWQMSGGTLVPGDAQIPGLQQTGGTLDLSARHFVANATATIAGDLTLAPAAVIFAAFDSPTNTPLIVNGQVNLAGARLTAGFTELALLGSTFKLIEKASPGPVTGTFVGLAEGAFINGTNESSGLITRYRLSYVGGDGNDITLTPVAPPPSGFTRTWTGASANVFWPTLANWISNTPPGEGDTALFPVSAARRVNTNSSPGLVLDALEWYGSNYVHSGTLSLLSGLRHGAAGGTNTITDALVVAYGENTWAISNAAATLRVTRSDDGEGGITGLGPVTKTGAGTLELVNVDFGASGGLIAQGGTTRLQNLNFNGEALVLQGGRIEAIGVSAESLTATNGELALLFAPVLDEPGDVFGGLSAFGGVTLGSNLTLTVQWTNGAFAALRATTLELNGARLNVTTPAGLPADETIRIAQYDFGALTGEFANLPEGAVTNIAGRAWEIHYAVEIPGESASTRFITLSAPRIAPRFTSIERLGNGDVILRGTANPGATVNIEASKILEAFSVIGSTVANGAGQFTFVESAPAFATRFYRAVLP